MHSIPVMEKAALGVIELMCHGRLVVVRKNDRHPEYYLWIDVDEKTFFLGVLENRMTRGDVKRMALCFLASKLEQ